MMPPHSSRRTVFQLAAFVALTTLAAACGQVRRGSLPTASLVFSNESLDQANVYAAGPDGNPIRIGTVLPGRTDTLIVPATVLGQGGSISVSARLLARSAVPRSGTFTIGPGDRMRIRLPADERRLIVMPDRS